jgi:hypothetical protein
MAYRRLAMTCHPDRGGSHESMVELNIAFAILSSPAERAKFDAAMSKVAENGHAARNSPSGSPPPADPDFDAGVRDWAESYPPRSEDLEAWIEGFLRSVSDDFKRPYGDLTDNVGTQSWSQLIFIVAAIAAVIALAMACPLAIPVIIIASLPFSRSGAQKMHTTRSRGPLPVSRRTGGRRIDPQLHYP